MSVAVVVIGRNEGERLKRCLSSLDGQVASIVYVDSGSTDGSAQYAKNVGAEVVELDMSHPFTAARARNAGLAALNESACDYVQTVDGDCELHPDWIGHARACLDKVPDVVAVAGRLRERRPDTNVWHRLADAEWAASPGEVAAVGGIALWRRIAIEAVSGFREELIAGEEPELCLRLRQNGWRVLRLETEMGWHDIGMTRFSQWWQRSRRAGHAYAEGFAQHGSGPERFCVAEMLRALIWGLALPVVAVLGALVTPWTLLVFLAYPAQVLRLSARGMRFEQALFLTLGKLAEAQGVMEYWWSRLRGRRRGLVEYK